jgi:ligand-binding sensor protein
MTSCAAAVSVNAAVREMTKIEKYNAFCLSIEVSLRKGSLRKLQNHIGTREAARIAAYRRIKA